MKDFSNFLGDGPACQTECGQQKGGNYFCWVCPILASRSSDFTHSHSLNYLSLEDRIKTVTLTKTSKQAARSKKTNYFSKLSVESLKSELRGRNVTIRPTNPNKELTKQELTSKLSETMCGNHRVPAPVFNHPTKPLSDHNLESYEVLPVEPLHVIKEHTKNLLNEIPDHLEDKAKKHFKNLKKISFNGKEAKRGCDYRESLISLCQTVPKNFPFLELLLTLCEITQLLYSYEEKRTVQSIFRLHNVGFRHYLLLREHFPQPTKLTPRKFYGQYYHSLIIHAPLQYRIIDGISSNAEEEERNFSDLKKFANHTSNHHADHIIYNSFLRSQAKSRESKGTNYQENVISKKARNLPPKLDSFFFFDEIKKYQRDFQTHLERIADYLMIGGMYWIETKNGIKFFDVTEVESCKLKHHIRSFTIKKEIHYLKDCWSICLADKDRLIPAFKIVVETNGKTETINLKTLTKSLETPVTATVAVTATPTITTPSSSGDSTAPVSQSTPLFPPYKKAKRTHIDNISPIEKSPTATSAETLKPETPSTSTTNETRLKTPPKTPSLKRKSPKSVNRDPEEPQFTIKPNVPKPTESEGYQSKSAKLLQTVFGKMDIIDQYDSLRIAMKKDRVTSSTKDNFKLNCAKLEVMVKNEIHRLQERKTKIEKEQLANSDFKCCAIKGSNKNYYKMVLRNLEILKSIVHIFI